MDVYNLVFSSRSKSGFQLPLQPCSSFRLIFPRSSPSKRATGASQLCTLRWKVYFGQPHIEVFQRLHEDFEDVSLSHIPWSRNGRGDRLAKEAMSKRYIFSHIDQTRTDGDAPRRIGSSATT
ncbi:hypothetical protein F2Q69_00002290 [Brassica cretica]|uniref:Uncharacterized protein n=1 Tax=Brassica cretica TaxID=69181 RepID=A0A8S9P1A6_BRACR|nr:hypothetical protein F2Q69_00002290 [Brassica cretica]